MARSKKPTGLKKVQYHVSKSWQKPHFKTLYLVLFALVFGWIGYRVFFVHAATTYPTDPDQIVAELRSEAGTHTTKDLSTGSVTGLMNPGDVIVAGDGTLYCTAADGSTTTGKLGPGEVKQLFDSVNGNDVRDLAKNQKLHIDANTNFDSYSTVIVNANDQAQAIFNQGDNSGTFTRTAAKLQQKCKNNGVGVKVNSLPNFKDLNTSDTQQTTFAAIMTRLFFARATAGVFYSGDGMFNDINNHRESYDDSATNKQPRTYEANHPPIDLTRKNCLDNIAATYAKKLVTSPWVHNPNLKAQINNQCTTSWTTFGENIGQGPGLTSVFNAFLDSPCHHVNIDARNISGDTAEGCHWDWSHAYERYKYVGVGVWVQDNGWHWYVVDFANW